MRKIGSGGVPDWTRRRPGHRGAVQETQAAPPEEDSRPAFPDSRSGQRAHNPMRMVFLIIFLIVLLNILSMLLPGTGEARRK